MKRRLLILAGLAVALGLGLAVTVADGDRHGGAPGASARDRGASARDRGSRARDGGSSSQTSPAGVLAGTPGGGAGGRQFTPGHRHPRVPVRARTYPRLRPHAGGRSTVFVLRFKRRRSLGPHGRAWAYYGAIVSPEKKASRPGCYGFGRYVMRGRRGEIARVPLHPRGRRWCPGSYQVAVYQTGKPYCPPKPANPSQPHPCSTASFVAIPTGWTYFTVR